jgi:hypothetical protein
MDSERPDQYRGVSYLAQVIEPLLQLRRYTESELTAAIVESFFTAFVKTEAGASDNPFNEVGSSLPEVSRDPKSTRWARPKQLMEPGEDVVFADPPSAPQALRLVLRAIYNRWALRSKSRPLLLKYFNCSFRARRAALLRRGLKLQKCARVVCR